ILRTIVGAEGGGHDPQTTVRWFPWCLRPGCRLGSSPSVFGPGGPTVFQHAAVGPPFACRASCADSLEAFKVCAAWAGMSAAITHRSLVTRRRTPFGCFEAAQPCKSRAFHAVVMTNCPAIGRFENESVVLDGDRST